MSANSAKKSKRVLIILLSVFLSITTVFLMLVIATFAFTVYIIKTGSFNGYMVIPSTNDSMKPTISSGDLIFFEKVSNSNDLKIGDIIVFKSDLNSDGTPEFNAHRIVEIIDYDEHLAFITKGDNNDYNDDYSVSASDIYGIYTGFKIKRLGLLYNLLSKK